MENLNFNGLIHIEENLYCLNDIAEKLICSKNIKEYMKKITCKRWINGNFYIHRDDMIQILLKSKSPYSAQYLEYLNNISIKDNKKYVPIKEELKEEIDLINLIHIENDLYCLNDIAEKLIYKKDIKSYMDRIINKKLIHGNYYVAKSDMKQLFVESKYKSSIGQEYINLIDNTDMVSSKDLQIENKEFIDYETNEIIYDNNRILFFEYNKDIYFRAKDVCDLLKYIDYKKAINTYIDKDNLFYFDRVLIKNVLIHLNKDIDLDTIFLNDFGLHSLITSSNLSEEEIKRIKHWFTSDILVSIYKTNSYNEIYDDVKLKTLEDIPCVYLIHVKDSLYKFGQTKHMLDRMNDHRKNLAYNHIRKIYELPNLDLAINVENKIKKYTQRSKIRRFINKGNEFFEINKDYPIERILMEIDLIVGDEILIYNELDKLINLEKEKNKRIELEIRKQELDLEILRFKENKPHHPIQPTQLEINITVKKDKSARHKTRKCIGCNIMIYNQSTRCIDCLSRFRLECAIRQNNRPTLEQLEEELKTNTYIDVGKKYNVSDNTIRNWIKQYKKK
jgi:hypothetical protein